ncbi:MAG: hypothetical protein ACK4TA_05415 [Saprospiraceae bacterium]
MQLNSLKLLRLFFVLMLGSTLLFTTGCDEDDDDEPDNEQELITTVTLTFTPTSGAAVVAAARDLDGAGGNAPTIQPINLKANTDYTLTVAFADESKTPAENITEEVEEESNEHLVCLVGSGSMPNPTVQDKDDAGKNLGLRSTLRTGAAGTGTLKITLKHEPDKNAANACSTGETDVEQTFNVTIAN